MPVGMEHERMRWRGMTGPQLVTRLRRITTREKLECFMTLCHENWTDPRTTGSRLLRHAALRAQELGFGSLVNRAASIQAMHERAERDSDIERRPRPLAAEPPPPPPIQSPRVIAEQMVQTLATRHTGIQMVAVLTGVGSPLVRVLCSHCSAGITEAPVPRRFGDVDRVVETASRLVLAHHASCPVLHVKEPEKPKMRVIRMGKVGEGK